MTHPTPVHYTARPRDPRMPAGARDSRGTSSANPAAARSSRHKCAKLWGNPSALGSPTWPGQSGPGRAQRISSFVERSSRSTTLQLSASAQSRRQRQTAGTRLASSRDAPMLRHAISTLLLAGLLLQPLSPALCADECQSHRSQHPSDTPAGHCAEDARDSPRRSSDETPPHNASSCGHSGAVCAALHTQPPELPAPPIVQLAVMPRPPCALLEAPVRHSMVVRQNTSPPGHAVGVTPLRI